ncbi:hypothetical protein TI05_03960 [Achromatium sp. WMS3]|nr:hypothetical protein TI05_03960 [Achromatium sp. WMS3]
MSISDKIRSIRKAKGLTQEQVAEKLEMSTNGYGDLERGDTDIKLSKLEKIAEILEMQLPELVDLSEKDNLNVTFNTCTQKKFYIGSATAELEKQLLINEFRLKEIALKDKELAILQQEIINLQKIIHLLENRPSIK